MAYLVYEDKLHLSLPTVMKWRVCDSVANDYVTSSFSISNLLYLDDQLRKGGSIESL